MGEEGWMWCQMVAVEAECRQKLAMCQVGTRGNNNPSVHEKQTALKIMQKNKEQWVELLIQ